MQYAVDIPPALRSQIDYVFITRENNKAIMKKTYDHFLGCIPTFEQYEQILTDVTKDHGVLVFDNTSKDSDLSKVLYWYKASSPPKHYKFGSQKIWEYHHKNYKDNQEDEPVTVSGKNVLKIKKVK